MSRPRRLGDHQLDPVARLVQRFKRWHSELGRAGEDDFQEGA
jgi:hypothetical protein